MSSPDALCVLLSRFTFSDLGHRLRIYCLHLPGHAWFSMFLQPKQKIFDQLCLHLWHGKKKIFCCFCRIMAQFELMEHKFRNLTVLHFPLHGFQITHGAKWCTTCQNTIYHDTTSHIVYLLWLELLQSCDIRAKNMYPKYCETLDWHLCLVILFYFKHFQYSLLLGSIHIFFYLLI